MKKKVTHHPRSSHWCILSNIGTKNGKVPTPQSAVAGY